MASQARTFSKVDKLNIIHVAGTKGKGSTCAFVESFLRAYGERTGFPRKTGLYTSPHLIDPEERIRINFQPLERHLFTKYFFEVWDILSEEESPPRFLQLFALLATHVFLREGVETAVFETHHGGEYDATNFFSQPVATIITPLGMDHANQLGPTLRNIAWHKAGIFKSKVHAFSAPQDSSVISVLESRATELEVPLKFVADDPKLPNDAVQLKPDVQRGNASVALACIRSFVQRLSPDKPFLLEDIKKGVSQFTWPGRFQYITRGTSQWFLDGAHNEMSVVKAAEWFGETAATMQSSSQTRRALIFAQVSQERDSSDVFKALALALKNIRFDHVVLARYNKGSSTDTDTESQLRSVPALHRPPNPLLHPFLSPIVFLELLLIINSDFAIIWRGVQPDSAIHLESSVEDAMNVTEGLAADSESFQIFVTGSLHLVGGALRYFQGPDQE
ncbi:folylpolyglutamate synthase [Nemania sp. FL0916]|nr:folylpolyglutamate synthase [Nemania sp. FL0916]